MLQPICKVFLHSISLMKCDNKKQNNSKKQKNISSAIAKIMKMKCTCNYNWLAYSPENHKKNLSNLLGDENVSVYLHVSVLNELSYCAQQRILANFGFISLFYRILASLTSVESLYFDYPLFEYLSVSNTKLGPLNICGCSRQNSSLYLESLDLEYLSMSNQISGP